MENLSHIQKRSIESCVNQNGRLIVAAYIETDDKGEIKTPLIKKVRI